MTWWPCHLMIWWPDDLMTWWPDDPMSWWPKGVAVDFSVGVFFWAFFGCGRAGVSFYPIYFFPSFWGSPLLPSEQKKLNYNWRQPGAGGNPVDENCNLQYGRFQKKPQQETQSLKTRHVIISFRNKPKSEETQGTLISMGSWNFFRKLYFFHVS